MNASRSGCPINLILSQMGVDFIGFHRIGRTGSTAGQSVRGSRFHSTA
jgi:hypothetical protein